MCRMTRTDSPLSRLEAEEGAPLPLLHLPLAGHPQPLGPSLSSVSPTCLQS